MSSCWIRDLPTVLCNMCEERVSVEVEGDKLLIGHCPCQVTDYPAGVTILEHSPNLRGE